jgi:hypothetical protein
MMKDRLMLWPLITALLRVFDLAGIIADVVSGPEAVLALTAVAVAGLTLLVVRRTLTARHDGDSSPVQAQALSLRRRASRATYVRLRDPDAAGNPRPRAPAMVAVAA